MAQAKRRYLSGGTSKSAANHQRSFQGVGMLLAGMLIGSLATILWQGMQSVDDGIGAGIRQMITQSKKQDQQETTNHVREQDTPVKQETQYDFYTVLPGIEVVVPTPTPTSEADSPSPTAQKNTVRKTADNATDTRITANTSAYMLQAGSYKNKADADRIKAELAFQGLVAAIQKVSIQDRGDFYRIRLGPYASYDDMVTIDKKLVAQGIKTLRLKISKSR